MYDVNEGVQDRMSKRLSFTKRRRSTTERLPNFCTSALHFGSFLPVHTFVTVFAGLIIATIHSNAFDSYSRACLYSLVRRSLNFQNILHL